MADQIYLSLWLPDFSESSMIETWGKVLEAFPASPALPGVRSVAVIPFEWSETAVFEQDYAEGADVALAAEAAREFLHPDYAYQASLHWDMWRLKNPEELADTDMEAIVDDEFLDKDESGVDATGESEEVSELSGDHRPGNRTDELLGWKRLPMEVTITCLGPEFEEVVAKTELDGSPESAFSVVPERPHLRVDLGLDTLFLPDDADHEDDHEVEDEDDEDWQESALCYRDNITQLLGFIRRIEKAVPLKSRLLWSASGDDLGERIRLAYRGE